jgi:hypothetical protein
MRTFFFIAHHAFALTLHMFALNFSFLHFSLKDSQSVSIPSHPQIDEMIKLLTNIIEEGPAVINSGNEEAIQDFKDEIINCNSGTYANINTLSLSLSTLMHIHFIYIFTLYFLCFFV